MSQFLYKVARADGTTMEGRIEGDDERSVRARLEGQGFLVFRLQRRGERLSLPVLGQGLLRRAGISRQEFLIFNQEFLALVKAGLPILTVWDLLIERSQRPAFQTILGSICEDIRGGTSLSDAMAGHPGYFPELYIAAIKAGEQSGNLPDVLQRYIVFLKLMIGLRQKTTKAMAYPAFLVVVGIAVVAFLLTYVLPTFSVIYGETSKGLPPATQGLLTVVRTMQAHLLMIATVTAATIIAVYLWIRSAAGRALWDRLVLRLPLIGDLLIKHTTVQVTRTLATVLAGGIPLMDALRIIRGAIANRYLAAGLASAIDHVQEGMPLAAALKKGHVLPRMAIEMIAVGEETGSLETMLRDVAEFHETELEQRLNLLTTWIEPVLLLVMGLIVGTIVVIMYLPIFEMAGTVR